MELIYGAQRRINRRLIARPVNASKGPLPGPLVYAGMFQTASGIGQAANACVDLLAEESPTPLIVDLSAAFNQIDVAPLVQLSPMPKARSGTLILHVNAPEVEPALQILGMMWPRRWRVIGYWAWELDIAPQKWLPVTRHLSELWTPSPFITDTFSPCLSIPVHTVPHYVSVPPFVSRGPSIVPSNVAHHPISCLVMADGRSSFERKNLIGAILLFQKAFEDDPAARLVVKTRNLAEFPDIGITLNTFLRNDHRISLIDETLSSADRWKLLAEADILLSAHRSEGFGLHLAEAMALGKCVVATGWSGNMSFMTSENSVLLPYRRVPVDDQFGIYTSTSIATWADIDIPASARLLREIACDAVRRIAIGKQAAKDIATKFGEDQITRTLRARIQGNT